MPTGYTLCIEDNADLTLKEFTLRCAKAFDACIMQREDDLAVPTLNVCSTYDSDEILTAQNKLLELEGMSSENKKILWESHTKEVSARNAMYRQEYDENVERYDRMQALVQNWGPPTQEHVGLKKFMLDQIKIGRPHGTLYQEPVFETAEKYIENVRDTAKRNLEYHTVKLVEERHRVANSNSWITALWDCFED